MNELSTKWHGLTWNVERSVRYHLRREGFFGVLHRWTAFLSVLTSSAAAAAIFAKEPDIALWFAFLVSLISGADLVLGFAKMEGQHADLRRRFIDVLSQLQEMPTEEAWRKLSQKRLEIEKDEPPVFRALDLAVHNELMRSRGHKPTEEKYKEHFHSLSWLQRFTMHLSKWESLA